MYPDTSRNPLAVGLWGRQRADRGATRGWRRCSGAWLGPLVGSAAGVGHGYAGAGLPLSQTSRFML